MKGIGVDIIEHSRIDLKIASKILTNNEQIIFESIKNEKRKTEYLASRFAVKEAVFKATNKEVSSFQEIEIINEKSGKPIIKHKKYNFEISISHENKYSIAFVILK